ncbi:MAG: PD-(D/E)XK nuclease family protein [Pseudomonadota bacterium]
MHALKQISLVAHDNDILRIVSNEVVNQAKHMLPDLRRITIFLPKQYSQTLLRDFIVEEASKYGKDAVLLPNICTLKNWVHEQADQKKPYLSQYARELILVDAVKQQPDLFSSANPWSIANELLTLFDEMLLNDVQPNDFNNFYDKSNTELSHALLHESDLIKILWQAWREQIQHENYTDPIEIYAQSLKNLMPESNAHFYCVALNKLSKLEHDLIYELSEGSNLSFYAYASGETLSCYTDAWLTGYIDDNTDTTFIKSIESSHFSSFMNQVFDNNDTSIKYRAERFAENFPNQELNNFFSIYKSNRFEQHCKAIDIQIRLWINENIQNIGVVTTDRKLIRRLRALLEHANVAVNDPAGWALSTTSAAVVLQWWLEIIENSYTAKQFIALTRSPFFPITDAKLHQQSINYFEKEVVLRQKVQHGLSHYRTRIEILFENNERHNERIDENIFQYLLSLLNIFESSAQLLSKLRKGNKYPLHRFISELINSLKPIGLYTKLNNDAAGTQIIDLLEKQAAQFKLIDNNINWSECRRFIARILDQQNFKPSSISNDNSPSITFCSLEQSYLQKFDTLIIASVDKNSFPSTNNHYVFFNEQVRRECSIPTWHDERAKQLHQFRCLLDSAPRILITVQTEKNGEIVLPSPWLEAIETFYKMAFSSTLKNHELEYLVDLNTTSVLHTTRNPSIRESKQPNPVLIDELIPSEISISQYQSLVNCPYQYYALSCLKLSPTEELQEELSKADFGSLVHESIHAFFVNVPALPGPFTTNVNISNRNEAEEMLQLISKKVFKNASNENEFDTKLWLARWSNLIPHFIDWEIKQQSKQAPKKHEIKVNANINQSFEAVGRIDRVDSSAKGDVIIDYKTGQTASKKSIINGEQVQLPMYAVLNDNDSQTKSHQVEFVAIGGNNSVKSTATIFGDELDQLKKHHLERLTEFFISIKNNIPFTALANEETCQRCDAFGICRRPYWSQ